MNSKSVGRPASLSKVYKTELILPAHTNALNSTFGGVIMSWIDVTAAIAAVRHTNKVVVTASVDAINFLRPIYVGWIVDLKASVNCVSQTSMEVGVRVEAESPLTNEKFHTASAYLTFVALDSHGKPCAIPPLILENKEDQRRNRAAIERRKSRLLLRETILKSENSPPKG